MSAHKVEIYTKWGCPYCVAAKGLLNRKGVSFEEYDITMGGPKRDVAIGGSDDLHALDHAGKLDPLLGL